MKGKITKIAFNAIFLITCIGITVFFVFRGEDFSNVVGYIKNASGLGWIVGIGLVVGFILCESVIIYYLMRNLNQQPKIIHCFLYSFVGFFFSLVTPTASGGQPMQIVFMSKDKLPIHVTTIVLMMVTIAYKAVLVFIGAIVLIIRPHRIMLLLKPVMGWVYLGMGLNVVCIGAMGMIIFSPVLAEKLIRILLSIVKFFSTKGFYRLKKKAVEYIGKYRQASMYMQKNPGVTLIVFAMTLVQRCLLFAVTFVVFKSFGIYNISLAEAIVLQGIISLSVDMLPLPGGVGISEHLFKRIFRPLCPQMLIVPTMIVSRGISFYAQLLISAVFTVVAYFVIFGGKRNDRIL